MDTGNKQISYPMENIQSSDVALNSPAHSLPNVSYLGSGFDSAGSLPGFDIMLPGGSIPALDSANQMPSTGRRPSEDSVQSTALCQSRDVTGSHLAEPVLHRALSTSPRLEHTEDDPQLPTKDDRGGRLVDSTEDMIYFPWSTATSTHDVDLASSLPIGKLHSALQRAKEADQIHGSDTVLHNDANARNDAVKKQSGGRIRSGIRGLVRFSSQPNGSTQSVREVKRGGAGRKYSRQESETSVGSIVLRRRSSSIFGSKLFESTSSIPSQRVNIVAESPGVYPTLASQYSSNCENSRTPQQVANNLESNGYFDVIPSFVPIGVNGHVSSASCLSEAKAATIVAENVTLQRSLSLPSRYAYHSTPPGTTPDHTSSNDGTLGSGGDRQHEDESNDGVPELKSAIPVTVTVVGGKKKWQMTMPELVEGPESETLTSHGPNREKLAAAALAIIRGEYKEVDDFADDAEPILDEHAERRRYFKNLFILSIVFFFIFTSYLALRNLQSSLNAVAGLGLYSLSSLYAFLFIGSMFTTTIVQRLQPKRALTVSMLSFMLYNMANFYPRFYTLVPASAVVGFFLAVLWTAHATYLTNISAGYAVLTGAETKDVISRFHGIFFVFFQASQIAGGLISSLLLKAPAPSTSSTAGILISDNSSWSNTSWYSNYSGSSYVGNDLPCNNGTCVQLCGSLYCPSGGLGSHGPRREVDVDQSMLYLLMAIFTACTLTGTAILIFFLEPLEGVMKKSHATLSDQMTAVFRFFFDRRVVCLLGLQLYSLLQVSFMFGEFTKAYVTCSLGVHMVGYLMLALSLSSGICAYITGSLQKYVGRTVLILTALVIQLVLLFILCFWNPSPDTLHIFFVISSFWGAADGIIVTQIISLLGTLFASNKEPAFAAHKMCQSLSTFTLFITAPYLCTQVKVFVVGIVLVLAVTGYICLELLLKMQAKDTEKEKKELQAVEIADDELQNGLTEKAGIVENGSNVVVVKM